MPDNGCPARVWARNATPEDVERLMLEKARYEAVRASLIQLAATLARRGETVVSRLIVDRIDAALRRDIRLEDLVHAHVNSGGSDA